MKKIIETILKDYKCNPFLNAKQIKAHKVFFFFFFAYVGSGRCKSDSVGGSLEQKWNNLAFLLGKLTFIHGSTCGWGKGSPGCPHGLYTPPPPALAGWRWLGGGATFLNTILAGWYSELSAPENPPMASLQFSTKSERNKFNYKTNHC